MLKKIVLTGLVCGVSLMASDLDRQLDVIGDSPKENNKLNIQEDFFTLNKIMKLKTEYNFVVDQTLDFDKKYPISKLDRDHWIQVVKDICEYEGLIFKLDNETHSIKIIKKDKVKINLTGTELKESHIKKVTELINSNYPEVKVYKYKKVMYLEGEKLEVKHSMKIVEDYYRSLANELTKYVINIYMTGDSETIGKAPMIDKFEKSPINKVVIQNPKFSHPYKIDLDGEVIEFVIFENYIQINNEKISKKEMNSAGYKYRGWFIETKKSVF